MRVAQEVKNFFDQKFSLPEDGVDVPALFRGLHADEQPFSEDEVQDCLQSMKMGKTTGISKVSVELLQCIAQSPQGVRGLASVFNDMLEAPEELCNTGLLVGWVVLLPKKPRVNDASMLRPIVLGEVVLKVLTKLCTRRLLLVWPAPKSCLGSVKGKGVADAAFLASVALQEVATVGAPVVVVKLDISGAYDSLKISALVSWMLRRWRPDVGRSLLLLACVLSSGSLCFHFLQEEWVTLQRVGTQQGATHSPVLFSYCVADTYDVITEEWEKNGETPSFVSSLRLSVCGAYGLLMTPRVFSLPRRSIAD